MRLKYYIKKGREGFGQGRIYFAGKGESDLKVIARPRITFDDADLRALKSLGITVQEISEPQR